MDISQDAPFNRAKLNKVKRSVQYKTIDMSLHFAFLNFIRLPNLSENRHLIFFPYITAKITPTYLDKERHCSVTQYNK